MRKFSKYFLFIISAFMFVSCLTACGKPSPASLGIESPTNDGGSQVPIENSGLIIFGDGEINKASKIARIEIETSNLSKIKEGYRVTLCLSRAINYSGVVKSLPDTNTIGDSSKCTIEAELDTVSDSDGADYSTMIYLPAKDGVWVVPRKCIKYGNNQRKYVWVTRKNVGEIKPDEGNWELIEVKTGETDRDRIEITEGLKGFKTIYWPL